MKSFRTASLLTALAFLALGSVNCASSRSTESLPEARTGIGTTTISLGGADIRGMDARFSLREVDDVTPVRDTVNAIAEEVWSLVPEVYVQLGVPIHGVNPEARLLGNTSFRAEGNFAETRLSQLVNCGRTLTGDVADEYDLHFSVLTQVEEADGRSVVASLVEATARPRNVAGSPQRCSSTGSLEREIVKRVRTQLVGIE